MKRHMAGLALLLALAGCGASENDGIATANGTGTNSTTSAATEVDGKEQALAYSQCMRENGVPDFPDPKFSDGGGVQLSLPEGVDKAAVEAAQEKCKKYMPNGGEPPPADPERAAQVREFAQCMRENGVPEFPDPDASGGLAIEGGPGMDPMSEEFKAAEAKCEEHRPGGPGGEQTHSEDGPGGQG